MEKKSHCFFNSQNLLLPLLSALRRASSSLVVADMAAELPPPDPKPKPPAPSHPPYEQMIIKAIVALNERKGSSSRAIAKYIDATFSNLPHSHAALLVHHLRRLKKKGVLQMVKHSYKLPKKASTKTDGPKRGPGRPPKPKPPVAGDGVLVKRGRGRPRKDPNAPKEVPRKPKVGRPRKAPLAAAPRPRGRPPKKAKADGVSAAAAAPAAIVVPLATSPDATPPKVRGRPKKVKPDGAKTAADKKEKRPRGRPKKEGGVPSSEKRPRGRPKKAPAPAPAPAPLPVAVPIQTT